MIWYTEELTCLEQPKETTLTLNGIFNSPDSGFSLIMLLLTIELKPDKKIVKVLMDKNRSFLSYEEPDPSDIKIKYYKQIIYFKGKIAKTKYQEILNW